MTRKNNFSGMTAAVIIACNMLGANAQITVDLSSNTGALKYGGIGFLYGLGDDGIPSDNMIAALVNPQVIAQKPPEGLQHPNGDAMKVTDLFKRNGGKKIQIYIQDAYKEWPYNNLGINDYLSKVNTVVAAVKSSPDRSMYVYNPFNEPDWIWYNVSTRKQAFFNDWKTVYTRIRSLDPTGPIAGPSLARYNATFYKDFFTFCKTNNCVPDETIWHELEDDFFTGWYSHLSNYRGIETSLGISPRPIIINEYARKNGDLGIPGKLIQWIARFENSKVDACLAYWTSAGCLNDLVTQNNKATGGWWLYKWYGELTGNTVTLTPPNANAQGLQGIACVDSTKKQARVIFGGATGSTNLIVKGFNSKTYFENSVHAIIWGVDQTGQNPSNGPVFKAEGDYTIANGQITVPFSGMVASSAYLMIITPNKDLSVASQISRYEAEYALLRGSVIASNNSGYSGTGYVEVSSNASTNFVITAADGYYNVKLRYSASSNPKISINLNGSLLSEISLSNAGTWVDGDIKLFLTAGINRIDFKNLDNGSVAIDYIDLTAIDGVSTSYEAETSVNTRSGTAVVSNNTAASGGKFVGHIGGGAANTLQFNNVNVSKAGLYRMVITYANGELGEGADNYNSNVVDRYADVFVNGGSVKRVWFRNTLGWSNFRTTVADVQLTNGNNTIKFTNNSKNCADIDRIAIYSALLELPVVPVVSPAIQNTRLTNFQFYPNPFRSSIVIHYSISGNNDLELKIFDTYGRMVNRFDRKSFGNRLQSFTWDGKNSSGQYVSSGTYIFNLSCLNFSKVVRVMKVAP